MNKLDLLRLSQEQDVEAYEEQDFEEQEGLKNKFKEKYCDFYDDVKQPSKYIKEDW